MSTEALPTLPPSPSQRGRQFFWETTDLAALSAEQWEALCDGCGKCCLHKLEDVDTGELFYTNVACRLLDLRTGLCARYAERTRWVPDCIPLTPSNVRNLDWLPTTCAYRLCAAGQPLPDWHPLISGDPCSTLRAGMSVRGLAIPEHRARRLEDHILETRL